jgi:quercetin dioxygenase-like cupin family protein
MTRPAHVVDPRDAETVAVLGPTVTFLTPPADGAPCLMRGTIPPSGSVPLHSHADPETFVVLEGAVEGLVMTGGGHRWVGLGAGDVFHVPGDVPHAWRNPRPEPVTTHIVSTAKMAAFFREVGTPVGEAPPARGGAPAVPRDRRPLRLLERHAGGERPRGSRDARPGVVSAVFAPSCRPARRRAGRREASRSARRTPSRPARRGWRPRPSRRWP